jgi:CRP-like cAMP-binding protein
MQSELELSHRGLRDRILVIKSLDVMTSLDDDALTLFAEYARERRFAKGDELLRAGQTIRFIYLIISGRVEVKRLGELLTHADRGGSVGVLSTLARDSIGVDAVADTDVLALEIPASAFRRTFEENFSVVRNALRLSTEQLLRMRGDLPVAPERAEEPQMGVWRDHEETLVERIIVARSSPLFASINLDAVVDMCRRMVEVRLPAGQELWTLGERSTFMFRLDYGKVRCTNREGKSVVVGANWALGTMDVFGDHPRSFRAVTETQVIGNRIEQEGMMAVLESNVELAMDVIALVSSQLLAGDRDQPAVTEPA